MPDIQSSVIPALRLRGSLNAGMPFEIASTPVRAVVPLEKAWRTRKRPIARMGSTSRGGGSGTGCSVPEEVADERRADGERHHRHEEERGHREHDARLLHPPQVHEHHEAPRATIASADRCSWTTGKAEATCATPDEIDTATVRM